MPLMDIQKTAQSQMEKIVEGFMKALAKLRTGRAHPGLLENVMVSAYGGQTPLRHLANIVAEDASTLAVHLYDPSLAPAAEKAIRTSGSSLNPMSAGSSLRVPVPVLTEERRKELVKLVRAEAEHARVAVRAVRRETNEKYKSLLKLKELGEDQARSGEEQVQALTDTTIKGIDRATRDKESELLTV